MENHKNFVCHDHQNYCTLVCINPDCVFKPMCEACVSGHYNHHMSEIFPLDQIMQKKLIMPTIFSQAFHKLKQTVFSLQMQVNNKRLENLKHFMFFCESLKRDFEDYLRNFHDRGKKLIDETYSSFPKEISELLQKITNFETSFDPNLNSPYFSSQRIQNSLKMQSTYRNHLFPHLEDEVRNLEQNIEGSFCRANEENLRGELTKFCEGFFKKYDNFKISKIKKGILPKIHQEKGRTKQNALSKSALISIKETFLDPYERAVKFEQNSDIIKNKENKNRSASPNKYFTNFEKDFASVNIIGSHLDMVNTICTVPYTNWLFSAGGDKIIKQWDYKANFLVKEFRGHTGDIWNIVYVGEENFIASASSDRTIKLWNILQGSCIKTLIGHIGVVRCLFFEYESKGLISGGSDQSIKVWDIYSGICKETLNGHNNIVRCFCWIPKENKLVSGGGDGVIKIWNFNKIEREVQSVISHNGEVWDIIYISELNILLSCGTDKMIRIWDVERWKIVKILLGHQNIVNKLVYLKDEKRIISSSSDFTLKLWNIDSGQNIRTFHEHTDVVPAILYEDGLIITCSWDRTIKKWSLFE